MSGTVEMYGLGVELSPIPTAKSYVFSALPTGALGALAVVTDSNTVVWGATIAGSSTNKVLAFYNGAAWTVAGK